MYILIILYNLNNNVKKNVLIRDIDTESFRRAKSVAALRGISLGSAVSEALTGWAKEAEKLDFEGEVKADRAFVRSAWGKLKLHKGKAVVIAGGRLQGVFKNYEEARIFSSKFRVALAFVVEAPPTEREIEIGPELEV